LNSGPEACRDAGRGEEPGLGGRVGVGSSDRSGIREEDGPAGPRRTRSWGAPYGRAGPVAEWWRTRAAYQDMRTRMPSRSQVGSSRWQVSKESTPRRKVPGVSPVRVGGQQVAGGEGCRGRRGCRLRDEMVVSSILSPRLKLIQVGSLRGRTVGRGGPEHVLVRPGARASGSPHQPGWVPGVRPPCVVGPPATGVRSVEYGLLGLAGTLARATGVSSPRVVPSIRRGECRDDLGLPPAVGPFAELVPGDHGRDGVRVGLLTPKTAGDSSSWTPR
jgi:hypothetical protein